MYRSRYSFLFVHGGLEASQWKVRGEEYPRCRTAIHSPQILPCPSEDSVPIAGEVARPLLGKATIAFLATAVGEVAKVGREIQMDEVQHADVDAVPLRCHRQQRLYPLPAAANSGAATAPEARHKPRSDV